MTTTTIQSEWTVTPKPCRPTTTRKTNAGIIITIILITPSDSLSSSSNELSENYEDDEQDETVASYAAQVEHLQEYEEALFDSCQDILENKEPVLTKQLRNVVKQAQDTVDYDQEKFVTDLRANLLQRQQVLDELQTRLQAFAECLEQEEQVAAAQRNKKQKGQMHLLRFPTDFSFFFESQWSIIHITT